MTSHMHKDVFVSWKYKRSNTRLNNENLKSKVGKRSNEKKL
jgi:hypothetical protein